MSIAKTNTIPKRPANKLFINESTDQAREQTLRREATVIDEYEHWEEEKSLNITNDNLLIRFNKTQEVFLSVTWILTILLTTAVTSEIVEKASSKEQVA